jgi:hypothetical protein
MSEQREILKYEVDSSDAEAKARELVALFGKVNAAAAAGEDTSDLEAQAESLAGGIGKLAGKEKEAASATKDLLQNKEKLAAVVRTLGGRFSGLIGDLGGVVELLTQGGSAATLFGIALAAVAAGTSIYVKWKRDLQELIDLQLKYNALISARQAAALGPQGAIEDTLLQFGGLTAATSDAAGLLANRLGQQFGLPSGRSGQAAAFGALGNLSFQDTGLLGVALAQGAQISSPQDVSRFFKDLTPEARGELERQLNAIRLTTVGRETQSQAEADRPARGRRPVDRLFERLKGTSVLPGDIEEGRGNAILARIQALEDEEQFLARLEADAEKAAKSGFSDPAKFARNFKIKQVRERVRIATRFRDLLARDQRRDRGLIGGQTDGLPALPEAPVPDNDAAREFLEKFNAPAERPATPPAGPPRIGDFTAPNVIVGPPAPTSQPVVHNHIRIGTLNARPGRGWIRRGGQAGFGTGSFNVADGGSA